MILLVMKIYVHTAKFISDRTKHCSKQAFLLVYAKAYVKLLSANNAHLHLAIQNLPSMWKHWQNIKTIASIESIDVPNE